MMYLREILFRRWLTVPIALLAFAVLSSPLRAADVVVNCNGGDDLQTAIDAAVDGDVLTIKGTCLGPFLIDGSTANDLKLEGTRKATLDGNGAGPVVTVDSRSVVFEHLTIEGGVASGFPGVAGLRLFSSDVMLVETIVTNNHAESDFFAVGGIDSESSTLTIIDSQVTGNTAVSEGTDGALAIGGINAEGTALTIIDSQVTGNTATSEGLNFAAATAGIASTFGSTLTIDDSVVEDNHASAVETSGEPFGFAEAIGGIQHLVSGAAIITNTLVRGNSGLGLSSGFGVGDGGIAAIETGPIAINVTQVLNNEAIGTHLATGGVEFFNNGSITLHDCKVNRNSAAADTAGGGILFNNGDATITDCNVTRNIASGSLSVGGIVNLGIGVVNVEDSNVRNNEPDDCFGLVCE